MTADSRRLTRRAFVVSLGLSGGAAVASACIAQPPAPTPTPPTAAPPAPATSTAAAPALGASASAPAAASPPQLFKPIPEQFFRPFGVNAETRFEHMGRNGYLTPSGLFFVRNHAASPRIDPKTWELRIEGSGVARPLTLSYDDLLKLPSKTVIRFLECTGNGRSFFQTFLQRPAQGTQWLLGAYGVASWTGVPLSELLERAGLKPTAVDVMPIGLDQPRVRRPMPVAKALEEDTLLVYAMNGEPLPIDHGFPARVLVAGWGGINSIKWVGAIEVSEEPLWVDWNTASYVLIGPDYQPEPPAKGPRTGPQVMKSAVALPWPATLPAGPQTVSGYAWSPHGRIAAVEVSVDGGRTFQAARLIEPNVERAGVRWEFSFELPPGQTTITPRARDEAGNVQPIDFAEQKWNELGYNFAVAVPHPVTGVA
jgi:DMSO/TMAO reductase YedYZ molybdopterin-dependent catalytic subunit